MPGKLLERLGILAEQVGEPPSLHHGGASSALTARPRNILAWFYDHVSLPRFMHSRFVLGICLRGSCTTGIDTNVFELRPDDGVLIFPFQAHYLVPPREGGYLNIAVTFALDDQADQSLLPLRDGVFKVSGKDIELLAELAVLAKDGSGRPKDEMAHLLSRFLCRKLVEKATEPELERRQEPAGSKYEQVVRHIREHIAEPLTAKDIAAATDISVPHLRRVFKERTGGLSLGKFILGLRIKRAYEMLMHSDQGVAEIAVRCGFTNAFIFSRAFKRVAGQAPAHYRKQAKS